AAACDWPDAPVSITAMKENSSRWPVLVFALLPSAVTPARGGGPPPEQVLADVKQFFEKTARPDGSFRPGIDPDYRGMSDSAYSNFAPVTYAVVLHRTFGWTLPHEEKTRDWILARQQKDGAFQHTAGTVDAKSAQGRGYNT